MQSVCKRIKSLMICAVILFSQPSWCTENNVPKGVDVNNFSLEVTFKTDFFLKACAGVAAGIFLYKRYMRPKALKVGVVTIEGAIEESDQIVGQLIYFFTKEDVKAVVLKIDSGGGVPGSAQAIFQTIGELKAAFPDKLVVAWVENIACSAAYYIAAAADVIVASPSAIVGSVGVIVQIPQLEKLLKRFDMRYEIITAGAFKATGNEFLEITEEGRQNFRDICDSMYKRFIADVQSKRKQLEERDPLDWADGKVFDADRGLELGLVDVIGSQLTVEYVIREVFGVEKRVIWLSPQQPSLLESWFGKYAKCAGGIRSSVDTLIDAIYARLKKNFERDYGMKARL